MILTSLTVLMAGCSQKEAYIYRNPEIEIGRTVSYALTPTLLGARPEELDSRVHNALLHERIRSAIIATLESKGYRQSSPETADFLVHFRVSVRTTERNVAGFVFHPTPAGLSSEPAPRLTVTRSLMTVMTEANLTIELLERQTGAVAYRAESHDDNATPRDTREWVITGTVEGLLQDL